MHHARPRELIGPEVAWGESAGRRTASIAHHPARAGARTLLEEDASRGVLVDAAVDQDALALQPNPDVPPEGVVAEAADPAGPMPQAGQGDADIALRARE